MSTPNSGAEPELADVARRIRALATAARDDGTDTRLLERLADDLDAGGAALAGSDLLTAYPPAVLLPDAPPRIWTALEGWVTVVRDVLVFAPIALTWWRLRDALTAYQRQNTQDTFLLAWARGFPEGSPPGPTTTTLGSSAAQVTLLIVLVVLLTLLLHLVHRSQEVRLSRETERQQLATDLALATLLLSAPPTPSGKPLDDRALRKLAVQLGTSTSQLESALLRASQEIVSVLETGPGSKLRTSLDAWTAAAAHLSQLAESLTVPGEMVQDLIRLRRETAEDGQRLRTALDALVTSLRQTQEATGQEIHRHDLAVASVRELARNLGEALLVFSQRTENLVDSTRSIWQVVDRLDQHDRQWPPPRLDNADPPPPAYRSGP
ncbi:hypothetical protein ACWGCW_21115 [Streptomyces sp. NPDC054933]